MSSKKNTREQIQAMARATFPRLIEAMVIDASAYPWDKISPVDYLSYLTLLTSGMLDLSLDFAKDHELEISEEKIISNIIQQVKNSKNKGNL